MRQFSFCYNHLLQSWRKAGASIEFFSPLADETPPLHADAIYLPGGYPELHGERLASAQIFKQGMMDAANRNVPIYGECGGYMVLGEGLEDGNHRRHEMLGLLPLETSFAKRKLHLGYRTAVPLPLGKNRWPGMISAHEFHYASIVHEGKSTPLFNIRDASGNNLGNAGAQRGSVCGSFLHAIDRWES